MLSIMLAATAHAQVDAQRYHSIGAPEGEIIIVPQPEANEVLVLYKGFSPTWDGRAKRYVREQASPRAQPRNFRLKGSNQVHLRDAQQTTMVFGTEVPYLSLMLDSGNEVKMVFAESADIHLVRQAQVAYMRAQSHVDSRIDANKQLTAASVDLTQACGSAPELKPDWNAFDARGQKSVPGRAVIHLRAMGELCQRDPDYLQAVQKLRAIAVLPPEKAGEHSATVRDATLEIRFDADSANLADTSTELLEQSL